MCVPQCDVKREGVFMHTHIIQMVNGSLTQSMLVFMAAGAALTCLENGGDVGGAFTVGRDCGHLDLVLLTTSQHKNLAASGGRSTV